MCNNDDRNKTHDEPKQVDWIEEFLNRDENLEIAEAEADYERWQTRIAENANNVIRKVEGATHRGMPHKTNHVDVYHLIKYIKLLKETNAATPGDAR